MKANIRDSVVQFAKLVIFEQGHATPEDCTILRNAFRLLATKATDQEIYQLTQLIALGSISEMNDES